MRIRKNAEINPEAELIAKASAALGHPARVEIFRYIHQNNKAFTPVCNKDLVEHFSFAQSTISQHLSVLTAAGLVEVKQKGTANFYYTNLGFLAQYLNGVKELINQ